MLVWSRVHGFQTLIAPNVCLHRENLHGLQTIFRTARPFERHWALDGDFNMAGSKGCISVREIHVALGLPELLTEAHVL